MPEETVLEYRDTPAKTTPMVGAPEADSVREIDLLALATLLLQRKKKIFQFALVTMALTAVVVFGLMKPMYTAEAVFLPPQTSPGSGLGQQLAGQLGSLGALGALGGIKNPGEIYLGILASRTVADAVIDRFDLQKFYKLKKRSDVEKKLKTRSLFTSEKNGLVSIHVEDHDPTRAAEMANAYMDVLRDQNRRLAITEAAQRRLFFEEQLEREKNLLADAEVNLKKTQEQTGIISPTGQAAMEIETTAQIRAQITSLQVELAAMKQGATDENPQVVRLQSQIGGLQQELQKLENDPSKRQPGNIQMPTAKVPELALEYVRKQRDVKYHELLFELIAKQYETARLDESRDAPVLQIVDHAVVPDKKSGPPRLVALFVSCILGLLAGAAWVLIENRINILRQDPEGVAKVQALRHAASLTS
jgi:tyrosine-protein kinase Etk/Wzc